MYLRISAGKLEASAAHDPAGRLRASESSLRPTVEALPGCRSFTVGADTCLNYLTDTSLRHSIEATDQVRELPDMHARADDRHLHDDDANSLIATVGRTEEPDRDAGCALLVKPGRTS